jgi:hypothetical protein
MAWNLKGQLVEPCTRVFVDDRADADQQRELEPKRFVTKSGARGEINWSG